MLNFVIAQNGKRKLVLSGFLFAKHSEGNDDKKIWRFEVRTCKARVHTRDNCIILKIGIHNHTTIHVRELVEATRFNMKRRAEETKEPTRLIVNNELVNIPETVVHFLPSKASISRDVQCHRQSVEPINPLKIVSFSNTQSGQLFLRGQNKDMIIWASDNDLDFLSRSNHWFADGTFKVSPSDFQQLYTIHGSINGEVFPLIYALLNSKTEATYKRFLQEIACLKPGIHPVSLIVDLELAATGTFQ